MKKLTLIILTLFTTCLSKQGLAQFSSEEQHQIDSMNIIINNPASHDTSLASAYVELSNILYVLSIDTVKYLCEKTETIAIEATKQTKNKAEILSFKKSLASAFNNIGYFYVSKGDISIGLDYYHKSLKIKEEIGDKKGIANCLGNIGYIYKDQGDITKGLEYYHKSLKIQEEIGDKEGIATSLNNIGVIYKDQGDISKGLEYYHKSLKIREEIGDKEGIAGSLNNIGFTYKNQGDLTKALEYYHKSLKIQEEIGDKKGIAVSLNNIGNFYDNQGNLTKALEYYHKSLKIKEEIGNKSGIAISLNNIGSVHYDQGEIGKAYEYCAKAYKLAQELESPDLINITTGLLYKIAQNQGNYNEAFTMYQLHIAMRDSINNEETYKATVQQTAKYEYEKQTAADSIVNAEAEKVHLANLAAEEAKTEKQALEVAAQKQQKWYLYIGLGLVALFGVFMFNRFKVTQKQKNVIDEQKQEVEQQKVTVEKTLGELKTTHLKLASTHDQLEESHKEITDSINYAERIQRSFLATKETLDTHLKDYFVFFKPKEAVSGDFYWAAQLNNNNFAFTVADSTGHGVPGAIMSLLNITSLEKSVETEIEPHKILNKTRETIINRLSKDGSEHGGKDGMDCNLMVLNQDKSVLTFASANNTIIIIRNGEILEYKGDKMPVGKHDRDTESFTMHTVQLQKGDVIYALTDGFPDQFGGPKGKKYMIKNLKNKFLKIADLPMEKQEETLSVDFTTWMADNEQIDDVCIIGVRV